MRAEDVDAADQVCVSSGELPTPTLQGQGISAPRARSLRSSFRAFAQELLGHGREYGATFITEFAVMASQIILYKLAAHYLGSSGFAEYALSRRTISMLFPIPILGLSVGLTRYIGFSNGKGDHTTALHYYGAALWCVGGAALGCLALINLFARPFAYLFFGDSAYDYLALPLSLVILGLCLHTVVCSYFRGQLAMGKANILQLANLAIVPSVGFTFFRHSIAAVLTATGLISTAVAIGASLGTPLRATLLDNRKEVRELFVYGVQRVPGDFVLMALFTLPATFVAHAKGIGEAGVVAFGISVVTLVGGIFAPVGLVLLPKATTMFAEGARAALRSHLNLLLRATALSSTVIALIIWIWIPELSRLYLGAGFEQVVPIVRLLILGALPYSLYLVLRNLVDAYHKSGVTAAILSGGLATFLAGAYFNIYVISGTGAVLIAFLVALTVIALLSGWETRRVLGAAPVQSTFCLQMDKQNTRTK